MNGQSLCFRSHPFAFSIDGNCQCLVLSGLTETESQSWMKHLRDLLWTSEAFNQQQFWSLSRQGKQKHFDALRKKWFGILGVGQQFIGLSRILASLCHAEIVLKSTTHSHSKSHAFDPFESEPKHLFSVRTLQKATWKPVALKSFGKGPSLINKFLQNKRWGQTTTE